MDCVSCGAPLPANSNVCTHCQTLNDVDLRAIQARAEKGPATDRLCPRCEIRMESISLGLEKELYVERCDRCLGIFFDLKELEMLLNQSVTGVYEVDRQRLQTLIKEEYRGIEPEVKYIKCPVCRQFMNRRIYGKKSGVIIDSCRDHGIWLDGGELGQILKWAKAGGRLYDAEAKAQAQRDAERQKRQKERERLEQLDDDYWRHNQPYGGGGLLDLVFSLFRS